MTDKQHDPSLSAPDDARYRDTSLAFRDRAKDLVSRMTLEEKIAQLGNSAPEIARLGVPAYDWWNEALHGVARAGVATVFPQAIGLAATFDPDLMRRVADVIADEARAKHHEFVRQGDRGIYKGLTMWSPNVNIFRDPRWGRGHETYGEDPYLTARMGVSFIHGLQGDDPQYMKVAATAKHFAVHSGPEQGRESFDSVVSQKDLHETYLPAFHACVTEGKAASVMSAYNRVNGEPCSASPALLLDILRDSWGFDGYTVSDCGAIDNIHEHHRVTANAPESIALAIRSGLNLTCGAVREHLLPAVQRGLISESDITQAAERLFESRFRLGMFDNDADVPFAQIPYEVNDSAEHRALARESARASCVLLKNQDQLLPLSPSLGSIAIIGPNADDRDVLMGNYHGTSSDPITVLKGIRDAVSSQTRVYYAKGCELLNRKGNDTLARGDRSGFAEAVSAAERADVVVMCLGLSPLIEGENGDAFNSDAAGDRVYIDLPSVQQALLEAVVAVGKPTVLVLLNGSALAVGWADEHVPAVLEAWYPGGEGGHGVADILFGVDSPSGRLPVTFVRDIADLPPFRDYSMRNRTYRYLEKEALYPFGYGLSYSRFEYGSVELDRQHVEVGEPVTATVTVTNVGDRNASEAVQCYLTDVEASVVVPRWQLKGVERVRLAPGEKASVSFQLTPWDMAVVTESGHRQVEPGRFRVYVGGAQPDKRSQRLTGAVVQSVEFVADGQTARLAYQKR